MGDTTLAWGLLGLYVAAIVGLTWWNRRRASTLEAFAVGNRTVSPVIIGLSLAANMTSAATFIINPGLVYAYGWSGVVGYGIAAPLGIFLGLTVTSKGFRAIGGSAAAVTIPQWIGRRYGDRRLTVLYAAISLLQVTFLVLIVAAIVHVLVAVLGVPVLPTLIAVVVFTFGYILLGGASVHVWSNTLQAGTMLAVAVLLVGSGLHFFSDGVGAFFARLDAVAPHFGSMTNPDSLLFRDLFEVVVANFVIGIAIIMQPHIMSKALYLRSERDVNRYLVTAVIAGTVFSSVLLVGLYARLDLGAGLMPDRVVATYIATQFAPALRAVIMLGVLAAGFSTLEGIALALATITAGDLYATLARLMGTSEESVRARVLGVGRWTLVALAPVTLLLAWKQIAAPSLSVAIFAQNGVYGLFAATFGPVLFGIFGRRPSAGLAGAAAVLALVVHFGMYYGGITHYHNNPAVPATCALITSCALLALGTRLARTEVRSEE